MMKKEHRFVWALGLAWVAMFVLASLDARAQALGGGDVPAFVEAVDGGALVCAELDGLRCAPMLDNFVACAESSERLRCKLDGSNVASPVGQERLWHITRLSTPRGPALLACAADEGTAEDAREWMSSCAMVVPRFMLCEGKPGFLSCAPPGPAPKKTGGKGPLIQASIIGAGSGG